MIGILLKIKHRLPFIWRGIEVSNSHLFRLLHSRRITANAKRCLEASELDGFRFCLLEDKHSYDVSEFLSTQPENRTEFFRPHGFDLKTVSRLARDPAFVMFGAFRHDELVGYFFLRCFWNKKCFVGRFIDQGWEGQGIGRFMNNILYNTAWNSGFRCMTTISRHNHAVMRSHAKNPSLRILRYLPNDYMLVELVRSDSRMSGTAAVRDRLGVD